MLRRARPARAAAPRRGRARDLPAADVAAPEQAPAQAAPEALMRVAAPPGAARPPAEGLRALQRTLGNRAVGRILARRAGALSRSAALIGQAQIAADPGAPIAQPDAAELQRWIQRAAEKVGTGYYNGDKDIFSLTGHQGVFIRSALKSRAGLTIYKQVEKTGELGLQGQEKYRLVDPPVTVELDERPPKERWTQALGGAFGDNFYVLPDGRYPHLSVAYTLAGETLTFGDAHYSRSQDDSRRLTYKRTDAGWAYENDVKGPGHEKAKSAADDLITEMTRQLGRM